MNSPHGILITTCFSSFHSRAHSLETSICVSSASSVVLSSAVMAKKLMEPSGESLEGGPG